MYRYGMTQWVMGNEPLEKSFERLQKCGYDDIEFAADPYGLDPERCLALMKKYGIGATSLCGMFGSDDRDLSADNADTAIRYLADSVDFSAERLKAAGICRWFENTEKNTTCKELVSYIKADIEQ